MSKKKTRKHHKPKVKPCVNYKTGSMLARMEERMNRIVKRMQEVTMDPRPLELVRDVAGQMCEETCKFRAFDDQAEE